jgi:pimeloyl-ACP methyl ester carboxylesterase
MPQVRVGERSVYYEIHGQGDGPPLLLVTGMAGTCRGWLPLQVPDFSQTRRTVIFDHPGVGDSDDDTAAGSTADLADNAVALLDALGIERADILGVFMGGMVAQEVALRHPERLDRLVLAGTYARPDAKRRLLLEHWRGLAGAGLPIEAVIRERLLWTLLDETLEQTDLIQSMIDFFTRDHAPIDADVLVRQCDACLGHDAADRLGDIRSRTLVICGERDLLTPPSLHRLLAEGIPDAHLVTIPYGAHLVMVESAEHFNKMVLQFMSDGR